MENAGLGQKRERAIDDLPNPMESIVAPGAGRGPREPVTCRSLWIPAFAGMT